MTYYGYETDAQPENARRKRRAGIFGFGASPLVAVGGATLVAGALFTMGLLSTQDDGGLDAFADDAGERPVAGVAAARNASAKGSTLSEPEPRPAAPDKIRGGAATRPGDGDLAALPPPRHVAAAPDPAFSSSPSSPRPASLSGATPETSREPVAVGAKPEASSRASDPVAASTAPVMTERSPDPASRDNTDAVPDSEDAPEPVAASVALETPVEEPIPAPPIADDASHAPRVDEGPPAGRTEPVAAGVAPTGPADGPDPDTGSDDMPVEPARGDDLAGEPAAGDATVEARSGPQPSSIDDASPGAAGSDHPGPDDAPASPPAFRLDPGGAYLVQVAALANRDATCTVWERLEREHPGMFVPAEKSVLRVDLDDGRQVYRMRAGGFPTRAEARRFCDTYAAAGGACFVTRR